MRAAGAAAVHIPLRRSRQGPVRVRRAGETALVRGAGRQLRISLNCGDTAWPGCLRQPGDRVDAGVPGLAEEGAARAYGGAATTVWSVTTKRANS